MNYSNPKFNAEHPFKVGIRSIINDHFAPGIAKNFELILEIEQYVLDPKRTPNLINQKRDEKWVCEVYYRSSSGLLTYICDLASWQSRASCEATFLQHVTDKLKTHAIGSDWQEKDIRVSQDILSGRHETPDSEITKYMAPKKEVKK